MSTVWILGAGFSRSLGAPLLYDFFTPRWDSLVRQSLMDDSTSEAVPYLSKLSELDELKTKLADGTWSNAWRNAEEFSELLDLAAERGPPAAAPSPKPPTSALANKPAPPTIP